MDLIDIRKKAKEAKAAKEAEAKTKPVPEPEVPSVPGPAPAREIAVRKVKSRQEKAAIPAIAIAETDLPAAPRAPEEAAPEEIPAPRIGGERHKEEEITGAPAEEETVPEPTSARHPLAEEEYREQEISAAPAEAVVTSESSGKIELLAFMLGDEEYALKMEEAREIIRWRKPTKVPRAPEYIIGIISLRGIILPVFDVKKRLGLGEMKPSRYTRIIVVSEGGSLSGMVVDRITGVTAVPEKGIESAPSVIGGNEAEYIEGVGRAGERLLILIKASRALS
jgi:purine-binding chemotaxis protein CheW